MQSVIPSLILGEVVGQQPFISSLSSQGNTSQLQANIKLGSQDFSLLLDALLSSLTSLQEFQNQGAGNETDLLSGEGSKGVEHPQVSIDALLTALVGAVLKSPSLNEGNVEGYIQTPGAVNPEKVVQTILDQLKVTVPGESGSEDNGKGKEGFPVLHTVLPGASDASEEVLSATSKDQVVSQSPSKEKETFVLPVDSGSVDKSSTQDEASSDSEKGFLNNSHKVSHVTKGDGNALDKQVTQHFEAEVQPDKPQVHESNLQPLEEVTHSVNHHQLSNTGSTAGNEGKHEAFPILGNRFLNVSDTLDKTAYITKEGNNLIVTLEPEALGKLNIHLSLDHGSVNVKINVANDTTKNLIQNNIQQIIDSLANEGLSLGSLSVQLGNDRWNWNEAYEKTHDTLKISSDEKDLEKVYLGSSRSSNPYMINGIISIFV